MKTADRLKEALENASQLEKIVKQIIREVNDYDLERLLKKIDAEFMDVRHNLTIARRLAEGLPRKPKGGKKTRRTTTLR
jgi:hypothetical protein